jgi:hypothetical protein
LRSDGSRRRDHGWASFVYVVELLTVLRGLTLVLKLSGHGRSAGTSEGRDLSGLWPCGNATATTVVGNAGIVVDDNGAVVNVGDVDDVNAIDGAVVVKIVAVPVAAIVAVAGVAETIINTAIEAYVWTPVAAVEAPAIVIPTPVTRSPKGAIVGRSTPGAGDPVIACGSPVPVTGGPKVVWCRGFGLLVFGEWWRGFAGVFDRHGLAVSVELFGGLGVLIVLILRLNLIRRRWRSGLLGNGLLRTGCCILLNALLGLSLRADSENLSLRGRRSGRGRLRLAVVDRGHVGVGGVGAGVLGDG